MSDLLDQTLLAQINRLDQIDFESIAKSANRLDQSAGDFKQSATASKAIAEQLIQTVKNINIPNEIKVTRHITIGVKDKYFLYAIVAFVLALIVSVGCVFYVMGNSQEMDNYKSTITNQGAFIEWMKADKTREKTLKKYIDETDARNKKK